MLKVGDKIRIKNKTGYKSLQVGDLLTVVSISDNSINAELIENRADIKHRYLLFPDDWELIKKDF